MQLVVHKVHRAKAELFKNTNRLVIVSSAIGDHATYLGLRAAPVE